MALTIRDEEGLKKMWEQMQKSMEAAPTLKDAKSLDKSELFNVPLTILGEREVGQKKNRYAIVMIGPFSGFSDYDLKYQTLPDGRRYIHATRDARPAPVKGKDKKAGKSLGDYTPANIDDVKDVFDPDCEHGLIYKDLIEGDTLEMRDETAGKLAKAGTVCMAAVEPMIWHAQKDKTFRIACQLKIKRMLTSIQMPIGDFVSWMIQQDMSTRHFQTEFPLYLKYQETNPSEQDLKNAAYRDNLVTLITGLPNDYRHPRFMKPNTSMLMDETDTSNDATFSVEDFETKVMKPILSFEYKGMQWNGKRDSPQYNEEDVLFAAFPNLYTDHIGPLDIASPSNWKKLMANVYDMMQGVYVGKENAKTGSQSKLNQDRVATTGGDWDEKMRTINESTGDRSFSFSLHFSTVAYIFDPVSFLESVCPRVTPEKIRERWGNKSAPKSIGVEYPKDFDSSKIVVCLSEIDTNTDLDHVLNDNRYEFRVFTAVSPVRKREKRDIYAKVSAMSPQDGDLFLDFIHKCVLTGEDEFLESNSNYGDDHPARLYKFKAQHDIEYFFAINKSEWDRRRNAALAKMKKFSGLKMIEAGGGAASANNSLAIKGRKRSADEAQLDDNGKDKKRQKASTSVSADDEEGDEEEDEEEDEELENDLLGDDDDDDDEDMEGLL